MLPNTACRVVISLASLIPFLALGSLAAPVENAPYLAPLHSPPLGLEIPGSFIVILRPSIQSDEHALVRQFAAGLGDVKHEFAIGQHFKGFAGEFGEEALHVLRAQPEVMLIERNSLVENVAVQHDAPWVSDGSYYSSWSDEGLEKGFFYCESMSLTPFICDRASPVSRTAPSPTFRRKSRTSTMWLLEREWTFTYLTRQLKRHSCGLRRLHLIASLPQRD